MTETWKEIRERQLAEQIRAARESIGTLPPPTRTQMTAEQIRQARAKLPQAGRDPTDEELAALQAEVSARAETAVERDGSIGAALPAVARLVADNCRSRNPPLWPADIAAFRCPKYNVSGWRMRGWDWARTRVKGMPGAGFLIAAIGAIASRASDPQQTRMKQLTLAWLAEKIGSCIDTAWRCVHQMERAGFLDTHMALVRVSGHADPQRNGVFRDANVYMLAGVTDDDFTIPPVPEDAETPAVAPTRGETMARRLVAKALRWGPSFGRVPPADIGMDTPSLRMWALASWRRIGAPKPA